eukprot:5427253-Prymnesium_polylepis.1
MTRAGRHPRSGTCHIWKGVTGGDRPSESRPARGHVAAGRQRASQRESKPPQGAEERPAGAQVWVGQVRGGGGGAAWGAAAGRFHQ